MLSFPKPQLKAVQVGTNAERTTTASAAGDYTIPTLQAGTYRVEIEAKGFKTLGAKRYCHYTGKHGPS